MRPVNLIPPEERRGEPRSGCAPARSPTSCSAPSSLVLLGVTAMVLTGNQISDRKAEVATLESSEAAAHGAGRRPRRRTPSSPRCSEERDGDRHQPRPEPLRLGARAARARARAARRRLAHRARPGPSPRRSALDRRRRRRAARLDRGAGARDHRLRAQPGAVAGVRRRARGHRRRHPGRRQRVGRARGASRRGQRAPTRAGATGATAATRELHHPASRSSPPSTRSPSPARRAAPAAPAHAGGAARTRAGSPTRRRAGGRRASRRRAERPRRRRRRQPRPGVATMKTQRPHDPARRRSARRWSRRSGSWSCSPEARGGLEARREVDELEARVAAAGAARGRRRGRQGELRRELPPGSSCSARRSPRTTTRRACWSQLSGSPTASEVELHDRSARRRGGGRDLATPRDRAGRRHRRRRPRPDRDPAPDGQPTPTGESAASRAPAPAGDRGAPPRGAADRRDRRPGGPAGDALRPRVHGRLLPDRRLRRRPRHAGAHRRRRRRRRRPPDDGRRLLAHAATADDGLPDADARRRASRPTSPRPTRALTAGATPGRPRRRRPRPRPTRPRPAAPDAATAQPTP